jgi:molybdate transport system substrate-binding protein
VQSDGHDLGARRWLKAVFAALAALLLATPAAPAEPDRLLIGAAASLRTALGGLLPALSTAADAQVDASYGASSTLARQIEGGAPIDLFLSADERTLDRLQSADLIDPSTRVALLGNALVVVAPDDSPLKVASPADLVSPTVKRIALPDNAVPLGHYARGWLREHGLLDKVVDRLVRTEDASATAAAVDSGEVDLAFVYRTDAKLLRRAKTVFEPADGPRIVYPAAVVRGPRAERARRALKALQGPEARAAFERAGFIFLPK